MANPNIVAVSSIYANTVFDADVAASAVSLLTCGSNKLQKINSLIIANIDGTNDADISVWVAESNGAARFYLAKTVTVPADSSLVITSKDTSFYLEENRRIIALASAAGDISLMASYEELDDA